ncbi:MAG: hypothetical protein HY340_02705 [Candidatus Kerfeldbacteria bacterium]|nr:hypothetical protein [Candidatus Kerfeldbacteria bacterium]
MKRFFIALALLFPAVVLATPASELPHGPRVELDAVGDSVLVQYDHSVVRVDTLGVTSGFSPGGTLDAPSIFAWGRSTVAQLADDQYLEVRGTASTEPHRWIGERDKTWHARDVLAAFARAKSFADSVNAVYPWSVRFNPEPLVGEEYRGDIVTTYGVKRTVIAYVQTTHHQAAPDTVYLSREAEPTKFGLGMEFGYGGLGTSGRWVSCPTVNLVIEKPTVRFDLGIGWRPAGTSQEFGDLADAMTIGTITWFPNSGAVGPFLGWVGATRYIRAETEYVTLSNGPSLGAAIRFDRVLTGLVRVGFARVSTDEIGTSQTWTNGGFVAVQLGRVF